MDAKRIGLNALPDGALDDALGADAPLVFSEIASGVCALWELNRGQIYMVTRGEDDQCVIVALAGCELHEVAPAIIDAVSASGFESLRFHTKRPGLGRMLERYGFSELERVYSLDLTGGEHGRSF